MSARKRCPKVEVEWLDSVSEGRWTDRDTIMRDATRDAMCHRSVGYLLAKTKDLILIAGSRGDNSTMVADTMQIPRKAVLSIRELSTKTELALLDVERHYRWLLAEYLRSTLSSWIAQGLDPKAELAKLKHERVRRTFEDWSALWLASRVDLSAGAHEGYRRSLKAINKTLGKIDPLTYTAPDAQDWILSQAHLAPGTVTGYVAKIRMVFDYAGVKENPWRDRSVKLPRRAQEEVNPPSTEHVIAILERVPVKALLVLAVLEQVGSRVSETLDLIFGDYDESERRLRFRRETTKTSRARWANLPEWLNEAIGRSCPREDRTPERRVFQGVTDHALRAWMRKACRDAGIPDYSPHDLRHRRISLWHGQGIPTKEVSARAGHGRASMTLDVYSHVMPQEEIPVETWLRLIGRGERVPSQKVRTR